MVRSVSGLEHVSGSIRSHEQDTAESSRAYGLPAPKCDEQASGETKRNANALRNGELLPDRLDVDLLRHIDVSTNQTLLRMPVARTSAQASMIPRHCLLHSSTYPQTMWDMADNAFLAGVRPLARFWRRQRPGRAAGVVMIVVNKPVILRACPLHSRFHRQTCVIPPSAWDHVARSGCPERRANDGRPSSLRTACRCFRYPRLDDGQQVSKKAWYVKPDIHRMLTLLWPNDPGVT